MVVGDGVNDIAVQVYVDACYLTVVLVCVHEGSHCDLLCLVCVLSDCFYGGHACSYAYCVFLRFVYCLSLDCPWHFSMPCCAWDSAARCEEPSSEPEAGRGRGLR